MVTTQTHLKNESAYKLSLLRNRPIGYNQQFFIYSPLISEIETFGEEDFFSAAYFLTISSAAVEDFCIERKIDIMTTTEFFFGYLYNSTKDLIRIERLIRFITKQKEVHILPAARRITFGKLDKENFIDDQSFPDFQNYVRLVLAKHTEVANDLDKILDPKVRSFKEKQLRAKAVIRRKNKQESNGEAYQISLSDMLTSIVIATGIPLPDLFSYNYFSICQLYDRARSKKVNDEKFQLLVQGVEIKDYSDWMMSIKNEEGEE